MSDDVYMNDELLYMWMVLDTKIMVKESNESDMCILDEFVKVSVFFRFFGFNLNCVLLQI